MENQLQNHNSFIETQKVVMDYLKHLTGLATGSIILLTVLLEKFFTSSDIELRYLVGVCFAFFILSVILFSLCSFGVLSSMRISHINSESNKVFSTLTFIGGFVFYIFGLMSLVIFAMSNWY